jgi:hypothetical protein
VFILELENSNDDSANVLTLVAHNSRIEAQELSGQKSDSKSVTAVKKGIAIVASPTEDIGTEDALVRLDQKGDGRIDQAEV